MRPAAEDIRLLVLPGDPLPEADAVVLAGHVLNYLPDEHAIGQALTAIARALRPGGLFAVDICDLASGRPGATPRPPPRPAMTGRSSPGSRCRHPAGSCARSLLSSAGDGSWRRDDETHHNVLTGAARVPALLAAEGVQVTMTSASGAEQLPTGLRVLIGRRAA